MKNRCGPVKPSIFGAAFPIQRFLIGGVADRHATEIGDVFAQRELAVYVQIAEHRAGVILRDEFIRLGVKSLAVVRWSTN